MELKRELFGTSSTTFFEIIEARFPGNPLNRLSLAQRHEGATRHYFETAHGRVKVFPVMAALVRELGHRGLPLAIASSSTHPIIDYNLGESGLAPLFRVRVSAVDVSRGKPAPDIMLEAARRLGFRPEACLVFEDSPLGLRAAKAAGMYCVSLPAPGSDLSKFSAADRLIEGGPGAAVLEELLAIVESRIKAASLS
jgi:HAD superfamily hydrolase (TIGR01509 family)